MSTRAQNIQNTIAISLHEAGFWTAYATSPENLAREVTSGHDERGLLKLLTREQLIDDAMQTARRHLDNAHKAADFLAAAETKTHVETVRESDLANKAQEILKNNGCILQMIPAIMPKEYTLLYTTTKFET